VTDAWERAQAVMGPFGDQRVSWSIVLQADLTEPLDPDAVRRRMAGLADRYRHLGGAPKVEDIPSPASVRTTFATTPYRRGEPLVRVAVGAAPPVLLIAAHHGAVDGLGLLALLGAALDTPVTSTAVGVANRPFARSFATTAVRRVATALFAPPTRVRPQPGPSGEEASEVLLATHLPATQIGTAAATAAAFCVVRDWNRAAGASDGRILAAIGASLRGGTDLVPEHRAAYLRLRLPRDADPQRVRDLLDRLRPEPTFPVSRNRLAALASQALAGRLGATFLVSNLGAVRVGAPVRSVAFFPQGTGRTAVAFGVTSTASTTSLTVRAKASAFSGAAAADLLKRFAACLP
jgi:hypothetical protein